MRGTIIKKAADDLSSRFNLTNRSNREQARILSAQTVLRPTLL